MPQAPPQPVMPAEGGEGTEQARIALAGRVGADPTFRTTDTGTLIAKFPLAVKQADDRTAWHRIVVFGPRAEKLQGGQLVKGERVEVIGYLHTREVPSKDGEMTRTIEELYAAVIRKPGAGK